MNPVRAWITSHPRAVFYALSLAIHLAIAPFLIHDWDGYVFIRTVQDFLHGHTPYATVEAGPSYIYIGDGAPVVNTWYAYPPLPMLLMVPGFVVMTLLFGPQPWAERVGIKLGVIAGDLALAFVAYKLVQLALAGQEGADRKARIVERVLLLNPFLIFVSAAWGMFDAWMIAFLLASVWLLLAKRPAWAGVAFAFAVLMKPFPVFVAPIVAALAFRWAGGWKGLSKWTAAGAAAGALICVPFLLEAPHGFLQQTLFNHLGRPPQGFTLAGIPLAFDWINHLIGTSLPTGATPEDISRWSFFALVSLLSLMWVKALRIESPRQAVSLLLATLVGVLVVGKVVNEQYFVMPVALAAVAFALTDRPLHKWTRRLYTIGGFGSAFFLGYHFLTFIPLDVGFRVFPFNPLVAVPKLTHWLGWNDQQAYVYPTLLAASFLVPALVISLRLLGGEILGPLRALWPLDRARWRLLPVPIAIICILLLAVPASALLLASKTEAPPLEGYQPPTGRLVGAYYYLWWNNPAHDPGQQYGNWESGVFATPAEGYYTTTAGKMANDFKTMHANGIDLVVYDYHAYDRPKLPALVRVAGDAGVTTAPIVDLLDMLDDPGQRPRDANGSAMPIEAGLSMRNETRDAIARAIADPVDGFAHFPTWWKIDGKPVVFLRPTQAVFYDLSGPTRDALVDAAYNLSGGNLSRAALVASVPASPDALRQPDAALWRQAYHVVVADFWRGVEAKVAQLQQPIFLVAGQTWDPDRGADNGAALSIARQGATEDGFLFSQSDLWVAHLDHEYADQAARWDAAALLAAQTIRPSGVPVFATVTPGHDDRALNPKTGFVVPYEVDGVTTYDRLWADATRMAPDVVLIDSYNDFRSGSAIEPTLERADALLKRTAQLAAAWKATPARAPSETLLVTNFLGASYHNGSGDPDGSGEFSSLLVAAAERALPGRVDAVDWNSARLNATNLSRYSLVVVEPGSKEPHGSAAEMLPARLQDYASGGGHVLLLGSDVGPTLAQLANWTEPPLLSTRLSLETPNGTVPLTVDPWTAKHDVPKNATVLLWMTDGARRMPALWDVPAGNGTIAVSAFRPQGTAATTAPPQDVFELFLAAARAGKVSP